MAKRAFDMTEPSTAIDDDVSEEKISPWKTLRSFALDAFYNRGRAQEDEDLMQVATIAGAYKYDDPEACYLLAKSKDIRPYSEDWLELMTKAAMAGQPGYDAKKPPREYQPTAADELGKYYLEKYGWFPCEGKPSDSRHSRIGFDWLELAAHTHPGQPEQMRTAYLKIAVVLRENDRQEEGLEVLKRCRDRMDDIPADEGSKAAAMARLEKFIDSWNGTLEADVNSVWLFGKPQMRQHGAM